MIRNYNKTIMTIRYILLVVVLIVFLSSCASTTNVDNCVNEDKAGFWYGLWHGIIAIISFIISLFTDKVCVYQVNNTGGWYDFGFILGIGGFSSATTRYKRK